MTDEQRDPVAADPTFRLVPLPQEVADDARLTLVLLQVLAIVLSIIADASVDNLLLARTSAPTPEFALRGTRREPRRRRSPRSLRRQLEAAPAAPRAAINRVSRSIPVWMVAGSTELKESRICRDRSAPRQNIRIGDTMTPYCAAQS